MLRMRLDPKSQTPAIRSGRENHYCARCQRTQPFVDHGPTLSCPKCERKLWRVAGK